MGLEVLMPDLSEPLIIRFAREIERLPIVRELEQIQFNGELSVEWTFTRQGGKLVNANVNQAIRDRIKIGS